MVDPDFARLLALQNKLFGKAGNTILGECLGLFLKESPTTYKSYSTPVNSITFASTGGDGVHFGFLQVEEAGVYPVVMTVPAGGRYKPDPRGNNVILGNNLREFLSLGCHNRYFQLEQLVYDFTGTVRSLSQSVNPPRFDARSIIQILKPEELVRIKAVFGKNWEEKSLMNPLIEEFNLRPWSNIEQRLAELSATYRPQLQFLDRKEWEAERTQRRNKQENIR